MTQNPELALLLASFSRNGRVNEAVLDAVAETDLASADGQGGWSVGQHLGHQAYFRYEWLSFISPPHAKDLPLVISGDEPNIYLTTQNLSEIKQAFSAGDVAALQAVESAIGEDRSFEGAYESHPAHFLQHILIHDAHHRGQVMSLLRENGRTPEQMAELERATWPVWRE